MSAFARLLKTGSIAQSMSVYLPAIVLQKALGLGRVVLLTWLISKTEMGFWGLAMMAFTLAAPLTTLGANHAMTRYVSAYEARGELQSFYRRARRWVLLLVVCSTGLALATSPWLVEGLLRFKQVVRGGSLVLNIYQWHMATATIVNIGLMGLYLCLLSFMYGLRVYRLVSVVEVVYSLIFTVLTVAWTLYRPEALSVLLAHAVSMGAALCLGGVLLEFGVRRLVRRQEAPLPPAPLADDVEPAPEADDVGPVISVRTGHLAPPSATSGVTFRRFVRFGLAALFGALLWQALGFVSFFMVYTWFDGRTAGPLLVFLRLSQPIAFLAAAAWAILFSHVARRWEHGERLMAMFVLETAYKALSLTIMTISVLIYATAPWWKDMVDPAFRYGYVYLPGLLTFSATMSNLTLLTMLGKLHERPSIIVLAALAAGGLNVLLAVLWMSPPYEWHVNGAARAAGLGMYFGGGLVMLVYLLAARVRLSDSTYFIIATPILLMLPAVWVGVAWGIILPVILLSNWVFGPREKNVLLSVIYRGMAGVGRLVPWR